MAKRTVLQMFYKYVPMNRGTSRCWHWRGSKDLRGYGKFRHGYAHRFMWMFEYGSVTPSDAIIQTCDNKSCVNPAHLQRVARKDIALKNRITGVRSSGGGANNTHCRLGHELVDDNIAIIGRGSVAEKRVCRICQRTRQNAYNAKIRARRAIAEMQERHKLLAESGIDVMSDEYEDIDYLDVGAVSVIGKRKAKWKQV